MGLPVLDLWFGAPPDEPGPDRADFSKVQRATDDTFAALSPADADVVKRLASPDEAIASAALGELHVVWAASLARYAEHVVRSADVADDLVQDVFLSLWKRRETIMPGGSLLSYLFGAVHRRSLQWLRHGRVADRWAGRIAAEISATSGIPRPTAPAPDAEVEALELAKLLRTTLEQLAPRQREAFLLYREQELSLSDVAAVMGTSVNTVKVQLQRAGARLREAVEAYLVG